MHGSSVVEVYNSKTRVLEGSSMAVGGEGAGLVATWSNNDLVGKSDVLPGF